MKQILYMKSSMIFKQKPASVIVHTLRYRLCTTRHRFMSYLPRPLPLTTEPYHHHRHHCQRYRQNSHN
uniref:Uncharacterized protein n=1 Tax=Glossina brevipalpis TaxID=37001 RepID=A0A1A9W817_9MUSC